MRNRPPTFPCNPDHSGPPDLVAQIQALRVQIANLHMTVNEQKDLINEIKAQGVSLAAQVQVLQDRIEQGGTGAISQADFDGIGVTLQEVKAQLVAIGVAAELRP